MRDRSELVKVSCIGQERGKDTLVFSSYGACALDHKPCGRNVYRGVPMV